MATDHESHCLHRKISFRSNALFDPESYIDFFSTVAHTAHMFLGLVRPIFDHLGSLPRSIQGSMLQRTPLPGRSVAHHWSDKPGQISPGILVLWLQVVGWEECS